MTPRFRDGLTVFDAKGQWLGHDGKLARENSKALLLIHAPGKESEANIEALRSGYKQQFAQDSVMRVDAPVCVAFKANSRPYGREWGLQHRAGDGR